MPTTLPSPVDRGEFRFLAVDATGVVWRWVDEETVWVAAGHDEDSGDGQAAEESDRGR